jgi:S1-C subfamily serine protease
MSTRTSVFCCLIAIVGLLRLAHAAEAQGNLVSDIWDKYRTSLVKIEVSGTDNAGTPVPVRQGTGIIIRPNGKIITALHVVGRATDWKLNPDQTLARVTNVYRQDANGIEQRLGSAAITEIPEFDLALLDVNALGFANVEIDVAEAQLGSHVVALPWDPGLGIGKPIEGQVTTTNRAIYGDRLTLVLNVIPGNSGAPVFGVNSKLIGIITNQIDANRALAVPAYLFANRIPGYSPPVTVTYRVCSGEYERACLGHDSYLYCGVSVEDWAKARCDSHKVQRLNTYGGNKCGYSLDAVICTGPK